ncbi:MAG: substrate-binding domain-containing protein [Lachnospiraceae bacterium]|nr:substrate-binding domain-containing protein [Lachnospiraceae bacterium]
MRKKALKNILILLLLFALLLPGGCGKEPVEETADTEYFEFEAVTEIQPGRPNVYVVLKVLTSQYWQDIVRGITDAGNDCGANVYVGATIGEGDWEIQQSLMEEAVYRGADAIILAPGSSSRLTPYAKEVRKKGIPVILVDTILNDTDSFDTCYMTDNLQAGELAAEEMILLLKESGLSENESASIAIQITSVSSQTVIDRLAGFNQYWSANAPKSWVVLDDVGLNNGDSELAKQNCIDVLETYPDIKGVFGCNNSSTVGFANGLMETGRTDVVLIGFDYADETAKLVASPQWCAATVVQSQYNMGYDGLMTAIQIIKGEAAAYKFIDTGTLVIDENSYLTYEQSLAGE